MRNEERAGEYRSKYGPWALVTGAASGIGAEFARQLGAMGLNILLVDRAEEAAIAHAKAIAEESPVETRVLAADLTSQDFIDEVRSFAASHEIGLLISNAALGTVGPFDVIPIADQLAALDVNCRAPLLLTHALLPAMIERERGGVILVASDSAYQGTPYTAHYAATKAYNLILGEGLWYEMKEFGIDVLAFAPGPTNTPGLRSANPRLEEGKEAPGIMLPGPTAAAALAALGKSPSARPNLRNQLNTLLQTRLLSRRRAIERIGRGMRGLRFLRKREATNSHADLDRTPTPEDRPPPDPRS